MYLMPLNSVLKNGLNGQFYVVYFTTKKKILGRSYPHSFKTALLMIAKPPFPLPLRKRLPEVME